MTVKCTKCGKYFDVDNIRIDNDEDEYLYEDCPYCGAGVRFYNEDYEEEEIEEGESEEDQVRRDFIEGITK